MARYIDKDGSPLKATTKIGVANELYETSFANVYAHNVHEWCAQAAERIQAQFGHTIEFSTLEEFVDELIRIKLIMEIN